MTTHEVLSNESVDNSQKSENQDKKSKKPPKDPSNNEKRSKNQQIYLQTVEVMNGIKQVSGMWRSFPYKFHVAQDRRGVTTYLEETEDKVIIDVDESKIINAIHAYWHEQCGFLVCKHSLFLKEATEAFKFWVSLSKRFDKRKIVPIAEKSRDVYCFHRLPFDFEKEMSAANEIPTIKEILSRTSNTRAMMGWIGSVFDEKADCQQYLWLHGQGLNGKGSITSELVKLLGESARGETAKAAKSNFWTWGLKGARLVVFGDENAASFVKGGEFKSLTGGDVIRVEEKGGKISSEFMKIKFMFNSNFAPKISSQRADLRRIIFSEFKKVETPHPNQDEYERLIAEEFPRFISDCWLTYQEIRKTSKSIPVDEKITEELAMFNEEAYEVFVEQHLILEPGLPEAFCMSALELKRCFEADKIMLDHERGAIIAYLERVHGIKRKRTSNRKSTVYLNCRAKYVVEISSNKQRDLKPIKGDF